MKLAGLNNFRPILVGAKNPEVALAEMPGPCDLFLSTYVFELIPYPEYGVRLLKIARNMLAPAGIAVIQIKYSDAKTRPPKRELREESCVERHVSSGGILDHCAAMRADAAADDTRATRKVGRRLELCLLPPGARLNALGPYASRVGVGTEPAPRLIPEYIYRAHSQPAANIRGRCKSLHFRTTPEWPLSTRPRRCYLALARSVAGSGSFIRRFGRPGCALNRPTGSPIKGSSARVSTHPLRYCCPATVFRDILAVLFGRLRVVKRQSPHDGCGLITSTRKPAARAIATAS